MPSNIHPTGRPHHNPRSLEKTTVHRSPEGILSETLSFTSPSVEPFECTFHNPPIEAIDRVSTETYSAVYVRHRPETTLLYQIVREYWPEFQAELASPGRYLPAYVSKEFDEYPEVRKTRAWVPESSLRILTKANSAATKNAFAASNRLAACRT